MAPPHPQHNGPTTPPTVDHLGPRGLIDRTEYVRLLEQALCALGYDGVAAQLEAASGIQQQPPQAAAFRHAILSGSYDEALRLLPSVAAEDGVVQHARFLLLRHKYLEGVQRGCTVEALQVLRQELQPLRVQQQVLHSLAALLLRGPASAGTAGASSGRTDNAASPSTTNGTAHGGAGSGTVVSVELLVEGRAALLAELQDSLMPSLLIPERRLEELVEQALVSQLERSPYHNCLRTHLSLFKDYQAGAEQLPSQPGQVLEDHSSEVWCVTFSPDGSWAASASKDGTALLWSVTSSGRFERPRVLVRQPVPCQLAAFSPDSRLLLTASLDSTVRLHDVATAKQLRQFPLGPEPVVAVSFFPGSQGLFLAATHKHLAVYNVHQTSGAPQQRLPSPHTYVYDAVVGPDASCVISVGQDRKIAFTRLKDLHVEVVPESGTVTSLSLSPCARFLTTNLSDNCVHLWQLPPSLTGPAGSADLGMNGLLGGLAVSSGSSVPCHPGGPAQQRQGAAGCDPFDTLPSTPMHEFRMADGRPSRFVLRSCVGGATSGFVACGAEDCRLYLWSRASGELLQCLGGHSGCINSVAWHPCNPHLIASASDDGTIRTWLAPAATAAHAGLS